MRNLIFGFCVAIAGGVIADVNAVAQTYEHASGRYDVKQEGLSFCGFSFGSIGQTGGSIEKLAYPYRRFRVAYVEHSLVGGKIFKVTLWDVLSCSDSRTDTVSVSLPKEYGGNVSHTYTTTQQGEFKSPSVRNAFLDRERIDIVRQLEQRYGVNFNYKEPRWYRSGDLDVVVGRYRFEMESPSFFGKLITTMPVSEIENAVKKASEWQGGWDGSVDFTLSVTDVELEREHNAAVSEKEEAERRQRKEERAREREERQRVENEERQRSRSVGYDVL